MTKKDRLSGSAPMPPVSNAANWAAAVHATKRLKKPISEGFFDPDALKNEGWERKEHFVFWVLEQVSPSDIGGQSYIGTDFDKALSWFDAKIVAETGFDPSDEDEQQYFLNAVLGIAQDDEQALAFIGDDVKKALIWYRDYSLYTKEYSPDLDLGYEEPDIAAGKMR